jgi:hypothetical protein
MRSIRNPNPHEDGVDVAYIWKGRRNTSWRNGKGKTPEVKRAIRAARKMDEEFKETVREDGTPRSG